MEVDWPKSPGEAPLSGLASLLLGYVVSMAALATLWPLNFRLQPLRWIAASSVEDVVLNLGLLLPVGFLWRLLHPQARLRCNLDVLALGIALSSVLEGLQLFLPTRVTSPTDVAMNGLGAWAGAGIHAYLRSRFGTSWVDRVCLALPLTKLLYLTGPLIGLEAWVAGGPAAIAGLLALAMFSAVIAGALHGRGPRGDDGPTGTLRFASGIAALFLVAVAPLWAHLPAQAMLLVPASFASGVFVLAVERVWPYRERRFELVAVRRAAPWFGLYLIVIALEPFGSPAAGGAARGMVLLRDVAAFSVLGYMLSQLHARRPGRGWRQQRGTAIWVTCAAAAFAYLRVLGSGIAATELGLLPAAAGLGVVIHRAELTLVRTLRGGRSDRPSGPIPGPSVVENLGSSLQHRDGIPRNS